MHITFLKYCGAWATQSIHTCILQGADRITTQSKDDTIRTEDLLRAGGEARNIL